MFDIVWTVLSLCRRFVDEGPSVNNAHSSTAQAAPATQNTNAPSSEKTGCAFTT